jgi:SAM-dependent methyltransferase
MTENFNQYSRYYDLLYATKPYEAEAEYVLDQVRRIRPVSPALLELGSGTGNHAQHFSTRGFAVTGVERSELMGKLSLAKHIPMFGHVLGDMTNFSIDKKFDLAVSLFHSICYLTSNEQLVQCFQNVRDHLNADGIFCFDFWYGPAVLQDIQATRERVVEGAGLCIHRSARTEMFTEKNVAVVHYEMDVYDDKSNHLEKVLERHPMRYLSIPEVDLICKQTGFKLIKSESFMTGGTPDRNTWNVLSILQRVD